MAAFITHSLTSTLSAASNAVTFLAVLLYDSSCFLQSQLVLSAGGNRPDLNLYLLYYYKDTSRSAIVQIHQRGNRCNTLVLQRLSAACPLPQTDTDTASCIAAQSSALRQLSTASLPLS